MNNKSFMKRALELAYLQLGNVSPNPAVGAVVVKGGKIISEGVTQKPGGDHAEVVALKSAGELAKGATLYVTLEPCCHVDKKTGPCTDAIIAAGVAKVVIGARDVNPEVSGKGIGALKDAGIEVVEGVLEAECRKCHEFFFKWIATKKPHVTIKAAMTRDGKMTWEDGIRKKITGEDALELAHVLRKRNDAILVGINTVLKDNPQLTCRFVEGKNPVRVILDSTLRISPEANVFKEEGRTIVFCLGGDLEKKTVLEEVAEIIVVPEVEGKVDLDSVLEELGKRELTSLLVEGGIATIASFVKQKKVDKFGLFFAPFEKPEGRGFIEHLKEKVLMENHLTANMLGDDMFIEGYP
jgi:diaminohydroxyphosphoribosylaminopyrimidine deaminase / 5-amino-6-(5-phosphoribosylamino)uracil reductase